MVARHRVRLRNRRGKSRLGCIFTLFLIAAGIYVGIPIGSTYLKYWRLEQEMRTQARVAPSIDDVTIVRRVRRKIDELGLPEEAKQISVRRTLRPPRIVIKTSYDVTIELLFYVRTFTLNPRVENPL